MTLISKFALYSLLLWASSAVATGVIFPLYIYPASAPTCNAWAPLISSYASFSGPHLICLIKFLLFSFRISAHPSTTFYIIVNPASGPGAANSQPNSDYQGCVPKLKASNVKIVGYVDTANGNRASSAVTQDIATYASWSTSYRPVGICFDDVTASSALFSIYSGWASTAKSSLNGGNGFVGFYACSFIIHI